MKVVDDSDQTDSDLDEMGANETRFLVSDDTDDLTDLESSTEDTQEDEETQENEETQDENSAPPLNRSDAHVYEEEYSPVEEIEAMPAPKPTPPAPRPVILDETLSDEKNACVICCEQLTSDGFHEIVVLTPCGHIFGRSCVTGGLEISWNSFSTVH